LAWTGRGTLVELSQTPEADPAPRRGVAWTGRGTLVERAHTGVELAWNCRGTAVEVALRAAKQPGAKSHAPDPLFLWRVVWKRGAHLSPFPVRRAVLTSGHIHAPGPPAAPDHEGMPQWSEGGQKAAQSRKEGRARALPDRHHSDPLGARPSQAMARRPFLAWAPAHHKGRPTPTSPGTLAVERLSWPVPLGTSRWTSVSPRVPRRCPACCCPRFPPVRAPEGCVRPYSTPLVAATGR